MPVTWGILSTARINELVLNGARRSDRVEMVAVASRDAARAERVARAFGVPRHYEGYAALVDDPEVDAVYIALPNSMHREYAVRAAEAGVHVLCEKPLAVTEEECGEMIGTAAKNNVKLMTAYRLHFEEANLKAIEVVQSGKLGEPRIFSSLFTMQVREGEEILWASQSRNLPGERDVS